MKFRTTVRLGGKTATGLVVPDDVVASLDAGKRPKVAVTLNGYTYRSTVGAMHGTYMVPSGLAAALQAEPAASTFFDSLAYTHRKEWVR